MVLSSNVRQQSCLHGAIYPLVAQQWRPHVAIDALLAVQWRPHKVAGLFFAKQKGSWHSG